jgi:hypothetical protein
MKPGVSKRMRGVAAATLFAAGLALGLTHIAVEIDTVGSPSAGGWAFIDFRDAFYYPGVALIDGRNPYASFEYSNNYPVASPYPLYSPAALLLHLPFSLLPYRPAQVADVALNVVAVVVLAALALRIAGLRATAASSLAVAGCLLLTRPGEQNLFLGQCTFYVVAGAYVALLRGRDRPWLAGAGLALAAIKPTTGGPLALLMLCRGDREAVLAGAGLSAVAVGIMLVPLLYVGGGVEGVIASIHENYAVFRDNPKVDAITSAGRVDLVALATRLVGRSLTGLENILASVMILSATAWAVRRQVRRGAPAALTISLICLATLICTYHLSYDAVLLAAPMTALIARPESVSAAGSKPWWRWPSVFLLAVAAFGYFASERSLALLGLSGSAWWLTTSAISIAFGALFLLWMLIEAAAQPVIRHGAALRPRAAKPSAAIE